MLYSEFLTHLANAYAEFNDTNYANSNAYLCFVLRGYNTFEERAIIDNFYKHAQVMLCDNDLFSHRNALENEIEAFQTEHGSFAVKIVEFYEPSRDTNAGDAPPEDSNKYRQRWLNDLAAIALHEEQSNK